MRQQELRFSGSSAAIEDVYPNPEACFVPAQELLKKGIPPLLGQKSPSPKEMQSVACLPKGYHSSYSGATALLKPQPLRLSLSLLQISELFEGMLIIFHHFCFFLWVSCQQVSSGLCPHLVTEGNNVC